MDNQFNSSAYHMPYSGSQQQSPAQQAPMGGYTPLTTSQGSQQQSPAQQDTHPTLPPLQSQNGYTHFGSLSYGGNGAPTPTSHTPTSSSAASYSHISPASAMGPPNTYNHHYPMSQSLMYPSPTSTSMPSSNGLATLRPAIPASIASLPSLSATHLGQQSSFMQNEEAPTHVVGQQGRRGILPSAPGRPNATTPGVSLKAMMPQKDADGKFPCPHCTKTYLHAKHLKRHMLRHTGDRPYSCHLCKDTFSRSDILKRHFQKCSLRRGNPTGANHLAHQRRGNNTNRLSMSQQDGPIGLAGLAEVTNGYSTGLSDNSPTVNGDVSTRTSRANSLISPATMSHRNSIAGLGIMGNNGSSDQLSAQQSFAPTMHTYGLPPVSSATMASAYQFTQPSMNGAYFTTPNSSQPLSYLGHQNSRFDHSHSNSPHQQSPNGDAIESSRIFQNGQEYLNGNITPATNSQSDNIKSEQEQKSFQSDMNGDSNSSGGMGGMLWP